MHFLAAYIQINEQTVYPIPYPTHAPSRPNSKYKAKKILIGIAPRRRTRAIATATYPCSFIPRTTPCIIFKTLSARQTAAMMGKALMTMSLTGFESSKINPTIGVLNNAKVNASGTKNVTVCIAMIIKTFFNQYFALIIYKNKFRVRGNND